MSGATGDALRAALAAEVARLPAQADPATEAEMMALLRALYAVGRRDLPLGRLLEGHVDAVQIVLRYGSATQAAALRAGIAAGRLLGVWNADLPGAPLELRGDRLDGGKSFASGAGVLSHALVTAATPAGRQLLLLDLAETPAAIDDDWWRVLGMQRSQTHRVRWRDARLPAAARIGDADDYVREPWFSGGALRFVAVQAGGVAAVFDAVRDHLAGAGRAGDPFQAARLAELLLCGERAASAVRRVVRGWFAGTEDAVRLAQVAAARVEVADAADRALVLAQQAVGVQGMFVEHPLSAVLTDLGVYLRQPGPDAQRLRVGAAAAAGLVGPAL